MGSMGIEEEDYIHDLACSLKLMGVTLGFVFLTVVFVFMHGKFPRSVTPGTLTSFLKRAVSVLKIVCSMCIAWGLVYSAKWQIAHITIIGSPNGIASRVILACI